jgi:hypothetical protein
MMDIVFLGHQGWLATSGGSSVLIDPLLKPSFGCAVPEPFEVYPGRDLDMSRFPQIRAVVLSHEHEDHFHIPSLAMIDRKVPVFLSERSSWACRRILRDMGFEVFPVVSEVPLSFDGVEIRAFGAEFDSDAKNMNEWDVMTYAVCGPESGEVFYSAVDVALPTTASRWLQTVGGPQACTFTNNWVSRHQFVSWELPPPGAAAMVRRAIDELGENRALGFRPQLVLATGGGMRLVRGGEPANSGFFPADNEETARLVGPIAENSFGTRFLGSQPGDTIRLDRGRAQLLPPGSCGFLRRDLEIVRGPYDATAAKIQDISPLVDGGRADSSTVPRLEVGLARLAEHLAACSFALGLLELSRSDLDGRRKGLVLILSVAGEEGYSYEYLPEETAFRPTDRAPEEYAVGAACWASDFLALLECRISSASLGFGRIIEWMSCKSAGGKGLSLSAQLSRIFHPLRFPGDYYRTYQEILASVPSQTAMVDVG